MNHERIDIESLQLQLEETKTTNVNLLKALKKISEQKGILTLDPIQRALYITTENTTIAKEAIQQATGENIVIEKYVYVDDMEMEIFQYLDNLRDSGETNMFGAGMYLREDFNVDRKQASAYLIKWMETFNLRHPK